MYLYDCQKEKTSSKKRILGLFGTSLGLGCRFLDYLYLRGYDTPIHSCQIDRVGNSGSRQQALAWKDQMDSPASHFECLSAGHRRMEYRTRFRSQTIRSPQREGSSFSNQRQLCRIYTPGLVSLAYSVCGRMIRGLCDGQTPTMYHSHAFVPSHHPFRQNVLRIFRYLFRLRAGSSTISHIIILDKAHGAAKDLQDSASLDAGDASDRDRGHTGDLAMPGASGVCGGRQSRGRWGRHGNRRFGSEL